MLSGLLKIRNTLVNSAKIAISTLFCFVFLQACVSAPNKNRAPHTLSTLRCANAQVHAGKIIGDGHCVSLIKACSGSPDTKFWRPGKRVLNNPALPSGTIIATFKNARYPNKHGYHAAIYIEHNDEGIWVWDQWQGKSVHKRFIRIRNDSASANNSAQAYRVVLLSGR